MKAARAYKMTFLIDCIIQVVRSRGKLERSCCPELASTIVLQVVENIKSK
jgi:hypothetical protein